MLTELFKAICAKQVEAHALQPVSRGEDRGKRYGLYNPATQKLEWHAAPPPARAHRAFDLTTLVEFAGQYEDAVFWYSRAGITLVLNECQDRDERVKLSLLLSPQMKALQVLEANKPGHTQKSLIFLLRSTFPDCLGPAGSILNTLRKVNFNQTAQGQSVVQHGRASLGKEVMAELTGADALPEYVTLCVPVFEQHLTVRKDVRCVLEPDPATQQFQLFPVAGAIERAVSDAEEGIRERLLQQLSDQGVIRPVYYGTPE